MGGSGSSSVPGLDRNGLERSISVPACTSTNGGDSAACVSSTASPHDPAPKYGEPSCHIEIHAGLREASYISLKTAARIRDVEEFDLVGGLSAQERYAEYALKWRDDFGQCSIERDQLILGDVHAIAGKELIVRG